MVCGVVSRFRFGMAIAMVAAPFGVIANVHAQQNQTSAAPIVRVVGTTLRVERPDGSTLEGARLVGAVLVAAFGDQRLRVRIAGIEKDPRDSSGEVLLYDFRVIEEAGNERPLCNPDPDGRQLGFPLAIESEPQGIRETGDPTRFELVCTSGAQGKCVRFGYAPWRRAPDGRSMLDWYSACIRMVRADYCGDGRPFTRDGTLIDIYDHIGLQRPEGDSSLTFEAAWTANGAACVAHTRIPELIDLDGLARACPRLQ